MFMEDDQQRPERSAGPTSEISLIHKGQMAFAASGRRRIIGHKSAAYHDH